MMNNTFEFQLVHLLIFLKSKFNPTISKSSLIVPETSILYN